MVLWVQTSSTSKVFCRQVSDVNRIDKYSTKGSYYYVLIYNKNNSYFSFWICFSTCSEQTRQLLYIH